MADIVLILGLSNVLLFCGVLLLGILAWSWRGTSQTALAAAPADPEIDYQRLVESFHAVLEEVGERTAEQQRDLGETVVTLRGAVSKNSIPMAERALASVTRMALANQVTLNRIGNVRVDLGTQWATEDESWAIDHASRFDHKPQRSRTTRVAHRGTQESSTVRNATATGTSTSSISARKVEGGYESYSANAWIAPYRGELPSSIDLQEVECCGLSTDRVSFLLDAPPDFFKFVIRLSGGGETYDLLASVLHVEPTSEEETNMYVIDGMLSGRVMLK